MRSSLAKNVSSAPTSAIAASLSMSILLLSGCVTAVTSWPQWGGPERNFVAHKARLADHWPENGPAKIWSRKLGEGYSSIVVDRGRVVTMYRSGEDEVVASLDADTGETVWEHRYPAPIYEGMEARFGNGPNATPALHGDRIYTFGVAGKIHCLDRRDGRVIWVRDTLSEFDARLPQYGCSASPLVYGGTLIVMIGGEGTGMMAFDLQDGSVVWKSQDCIDTYSSPIRITVNGEDQIVVLTNDTIIGVDPVDGERKWQVAHENQWKTNISTPIWGDDNLLFVSSSGDAGSRVLKLSRKAGTTEVQELWVSRKMKVGQGAAVRVGNFVYGSSGAESAHFIAAIDVQSGKLAWRERGFAKANLIHADGKFVILDEDGQLALATATPEGLTVRSKVKIFDGRSWTAPTIVGSRLYTRDRENILAFDLN